MNLVCQPDVRVREFFVEHRCYAVLVVIVDRGGGGFAEGDFGAHERDGRGFMGWGECRADCLIHCRFQDLIFVFDDHHIFLLQHFH